MDIQRIVFNSRILRSVSSLDSKEFEEMLEVFEKRWEKLHEDRTRDGQQRQRARGGGFKGQLPTARHKLLFILMYFKLYPIQEAMGVFFGMSQVQVHDWIHRLSPVLKQTLGRELQLPERRPVRMHEVLSQCPELKFVMDGTDRRIRRPRNKDEQKSCYSGKRKTHTKKNLLIVSGRRVKYLSRTVSGSVHDLRLTDEIRRRHFPKQSALFVDLGFQGYRPQGAELWIPEKKPKGKTLPPWWKTINRAMASLRVGVEHVISGIKRCHIVADIFRNYKKGYDDLVMEIACGLHNFRTTARSKPL